MAKKFSQFAMIDAFRVALSNPKVGSTVSVSVFKEARLATVRVTCDAGAPDEKTAKKAAKLVGKQAGASLELLTCKSLNRWVSDFTFRMVPNMPKNRAPTKAQRTKWTNAVKRTRRLQRVAA
jgi:hypothetical protein